MEDYIVQSSSGTVIDLTSSAPLAWGYNNVTVTLSNGDQLIVTIGLSDLVVLNGNRYTYSGGELIPQPIPDEDDSLMENLWERADQLWNFIRDKNTKGPRGGLGLGSGVFGAGDNDSSPRETVGANEMEHDDPEGPGGSNDYDGEDGTCTGEGDLQGGGDGDGDREGSGSGGGGTGSGSTDGPLEGIGLMSFAFSFGGADGYGDDYDGCSSA